MSRRPVRSLLTDMLERIARIERYVAGLDLDGFRRDERTHDAVVRGLEVIGEAASRLPLAFREGAREVPWHRIVGLRNRIVHAYFDVDLELVWEIVQAELPGLKRLLEVLAESAGQENDPDP